MAKQKQKNKVTSKNGQGKEISCTGSFRDVVATATTWKLKKYTDLKFYAWDGKGWVEDKQ